MALGTVNVAGQTYTHPSYPAHSDGLYLITVDALGHVSSVTSVQKSDITALGIPGQDTTYSAATTSADGLMSSTDKTKLDGITAGSIASGNTGYATGGDVYTELSEKAATTSVPASASVGSTGLVTFKNSSGTDLFTVQLPLYNGGVS